MKFMKKGVMALIFLSLILVSGIEGCPSVGKTDTTTTAAGLEVSFVNEAPPSSIPVDQPFPIYVNILNEGGDFIKAGDAQFYLSGIGLNLEGVQEKQSNINSLSKESITPDRIVFAEEAKFTFPLESLLTLPVSLTSCYDYGTRIQARICISTSNETELCTVGDNKITSTSNSVAPVQITNLKEELSGNRYRVFFTIENKMGGRIYLPDANCDKLFSKEDPFESFKKDKVTVEIRTTEPGFVCKLQTAAAPFAPIDATSGVADVGTVVCEKELAQKEYRVAPFSIVLRYTYMDTVIKRLNIVP